MNAGLLIGVIFLAIVFVLIAFLLFGMGKGDE